jgi:hypothetical protein
VARRVAHERRIDAPRNGIAERERVVVRKSEPIAIARTAINTARSSGDHV